MVKSDMLTSTWISVAVFTSMVVTAGLQAQNRHVIPSDLLESQQAQKAQGSSAIINLNVKDSSLKYVVNEIARQAGLRVIYDNSNPLAIKKITVSIAGLPVTSAYTTALAGTGLTMKFAPDGETVIIALPAVPGKKVAESNGNIQTGTISGRIVDSATGKAVVGVSVTVGGTKLSALSDGNGLYQISNLKPGKYQITFRILGYRSATSQIQVGPQGRTTLDIKIVQTTTALNEVVTTAIGTQRRVEIGNDIVKLNAAEILEKAPARTVTDMLRFAQVPGVSVQTSSGEPGSPSRIRIRGIGSISQNTDPAVIVDGVWVSSRMSDASVLNKAWGDGTMGQFSKNHSYVGSPIDQIDPETIESIEIIKGPSAASLYGQEAANGVIVITTKRGKSGPTLWSYTFSKDWDAQVRNNYGNWFGYGTSQTGELYSGSCDIDRHISLSCRQDSVIDLNSYEEIFKRTGPGSFLSHGASVSGGSGSVSYLISGMYRSNQGTRRISRIDFARARLQEIPLGKEFENPTQSQEYGLTTNMGMVLSPKLSINLVATGAESRKNQADLTSTLSEGNFDTVGLSASIKTMGGGSSNTALKFSSAATYNPVEWWTTIGNAGVDIVNRQDDGINDYWSCSRGVCSPEIAAGNVRLRQNRISELVSTARINGTARVNTRIERLLAITPTIGLDIRKNRRKELSGNLWDVPVGSQQGSGTGAVTMSQSDVVTAGYFINGSFRLIERMYFDLGFRQDAGSVIKLNKSSRYPKLATSWLVSEEPFFPFSQKINLLKLRIAAGYAAIHPNEADIYGKYIYQRAKVNNNSEWIAELSGVGNRKLVPERSFEIEGGFDAALLNDRVDLSFTIANKKLRNAIIDRKLPVSSGVGNGSRKENISSVVNRSIELDVSARVIDNDFMLLELRAGVGNVNNVIKKLGNNVLSSSNTMIDRLVEGYQIGAVWDRPVLGYNDLDKNGRLVNSEIVLGDTTVYRGWNMPKFTGSYSGSMALFNRSLTLAFTLSHTGSRVQYTTFLDNYGTVVVGAPIEKQAMALFSNSNNGSAVSVSDIRLGSASLGYSLPKSVTKHLGTKMIRLSLQGSNLGLWSKYSGDDPSVNSSPIGNMIRDNGQTLPQPRKYALNVKVDF